MNLAEARRYTRRVPNVVDPSDFFSFVGGLNLVDPPLQIKPGQCLAGRNYEPYTRGGYERLSGYERFDGQLKPSQAKYWILKFGDGIPAQYPVIGDTVTGDNTGATGMSVGIVHDGGVGYVVLVRCEGDFQVGESLTVAGAFGNAESTNLAGSAPNDELDAVYRQLAVEDARSLITAVPGEGPIRGVCTYKGRGYAVRDKVGGLEGGLWRSSEFGWEECGTGLRLSFDAGTAQFLNGETVTGGTSGATAVIRRVVLRNNDWLTEDAVGFLVVTDVVGTFADDEVLTSAGGAAVVDGAIAEITLPPGGVYEFRVHNFFGHGSTKRLYAVNGVGRAFEYEDDPEFLCPIETGMATDAPNHLAVFKNQLWLMFPGGSIQKSGAGEPTDWTVVTGAAELGIGDEGTGFLEEIGGVLFVFSKNRTKYIQGNESDGYVMDDFGQETGAVANSIQRIGKGIYLDDRGFTTLAAAQEFGNFASNSVSEVVQPLVEALRPMFVTSVVNRTKNRARFFFSDKRFLTLGYNGNKLSGFMLCDYPVAVRCTFSGEGPAGEELILFGTDDGYVYEADRGTSFDGAAIEAFLRPVFHHSGTPSQIKRYRRAQVDVVTAGPTTLKAAVDYSFADPSASGEPIKDVTLRGGGGFWNVANWNEFRWSAGVVATAILKLEGSGYNIGLLFSHSSATELPHRLSGVNFHLSRRRLNRSTV